MASREGFSLTEVLVALAIVAIMGTFVALNLVGTADEARVANTAAQLDTLATAVTLYQNQQGALPTQRQGLRALVERPTTEPVPPRYPGGGYLASSEVPVDAWGRPFVYLTPGRAGEPFEILSYGADGLEGGDGADADLSTSD